MFDIGWTEMAMVAVVALLIIGPRDLPKTLHTIGRWVGRARAVMNDFQRGLDDMVRETELDEMRKQLESAADLDIGKEIENSIDPTGEMADALDFNEDASDVKEDASAQAETPPAVTTAEPDVGEEAADQPTPPRDAESGGRP